MKDWSISSVSTGWESWDCSAGEEKAQEGSHWLCVQTSEGRVQRGWSQALFSGARWQHQRQWAQAEEEEAVWTPGNIFFYCEGDQALAQVSQRGCEVSIIGGVQKLPGHGPGKHALGCPPWVGWLNQTTSRGPLQPQPFCDSVKNYLSLDFDWEILINCLFP